MLKTIRIIFIIAKLILIYENSIINNVYNTKVIEAIFGAKTAKSKSKNLVKS